MMKTLNLTPLERRILWEAARSIGDDIDNYGFSAIEKRAYQRALEKLERIEEVDATVRST